MLTLKSTLAFGAGISVLYGIYFRVTLPPAASTRILDRALVRQLALTGGLRDRPVASSPLLNVRAIVTGATSGLGREVASELYNLGATVVLASRSAKKALSTMESIRKEYPNSEGSLDFGALETSSLETVKEFVEWYKSKYNSLHVLVNNAGMHYGTGMTPSPFVDPSIKTVSKEGYDLAFATNYLGHFLLTRLLLEMLVQTEKEVGKPGRIVNVASTFSMQSDGTMLTAKDGNMPIAARSDIFTRSHRSASYANNKLAQVLHAKELQRRIDNGLVGSTGLKIFSTCPAWSGTPFLGTGSMSDWVRRNAFTPKAAIIGILGAILDTKKFKGGEFVTCWKNELSSQFWFRPLMAMATKLNIRETLCYIGAGYVLLTQNRRYGYFDERTTAEGEDEELAGSLFDWSMKATSSFA